jgi:hypothetical protein
MAQRGDKRTPPPPKMKAEDVILAIAAYKVVRKTAPVMPPPGRATIEHQGRISRAIKAFEAGETVYDVRVEAELQGEANGTASIEFEGVLADELQLSAARAIATLARGMGERIVEVSTPGIAPPNAGQG